MSGRWESCIPIGGAYWPRRVPAKLGDMDLTPSFARFAPRLSFAELMAALQDYVRTRDVRVHSRAMTLERPAEFDGVSITINTRHDLESRCYYLLHSFGSIVGWSVDFDRVTAIFDTLRLAKASRELEPEALEEAIEAFRGFEERASEYGVFALHDLGCPSAVPGFSEFFRADLEAITEFHRRGRAPVWPEFLALWQSDIAAGRRVDRPFHSRPIPSFQPKPIERQEVTQERGRGLQKDRRRHSLVRRVRL